MPKDINTIISQDTLMKIEIAKRYIEKKYQKSYDEEQRKKLMYDKIIHKMA